MMQKETAGEKKHTLSVTARKCASLTGVCDVQSFDERTVILKTDCGELCVEGEELRVGTLDVERGVVELTGHICALYYSDAAPAKKGLRARLFR